MEGVRRSHVARAQPVKRATTRNRPLTHHELLCNKIGWLSRLHFYGMMATLCIFFILGCLLMGFKITRSVSTKALGGDVAWLQKDKLKKLKEGFLKLKYI